MRDQFRRCAACGDYHWTSEWPHNHRAPERQRSDLPSPYVISDTMDLLFHPVDNGHYDSKSQFRRITERSGNIEMGNDMQRDTRYVDTVDASEVAQAKQMVDQGYQPVAEQATADETRDAI